MTKKQIKENIPKVTRLTNTDYSNEDAALPFVKGLHSSFCLDCGMKITPQKELDYLDEIGENWFDIHHRWHRKMYDRN